MTKEGANGVRVAQKAHAYVNPYFASRSTLGLEGPMKAPPALLQPPRELAESLRILQERLGSVKGAIERTERKRAWQENSPPVTKTKVAITEVRNAEETRRSAEDNRIISLIVRRTQVSDPKLRQLIDAGIEGLGFDSEVVCDCEGTVYFFHAADRAFAQMIKGNSAALSSIFGSRRLPKFVESVSINGIDYVVTRREKVTESTCETIVEPKQREEKRATKGAKIFDLEAARAKKAKRYGKETRPDELAA